VLASDTNDPDVRAQAVDLPLAAAAGVGFSQAQDIVNFEIEYRHITTQLGLIVSRKPGRVYSGIKRLISSRSDRTALRAAVAKSAPDDA